MAKKSSRHSESNGNGSHVVVSARSKMQKKYISQIIKNDITICSGPAGTGKTAVAVGMGLDFLLSEGSPYEKLVLLRPVREACGESIGYLPGDLMEKMAPWAAPVVDNMRIFLSDSKIKTLMYSKSVEVIPLALARGRSLNNSFIILDEAQNCSPDQILMVLTRMGEGSKMVIEGDISQRDVPAEGLSDAIRRIGDLNGVGTIEFGLKDVVRNPLISKIIERYSDGDERLEDDWRRTDPEDIGLEEWQYADR